ncbi:hypothetical protein DID88_005997 [Monilinia fructigena]|uniref:Uncharacterized protein n=1 Tax=Monilinia fructigena TaxID=38457 RepID=A0A395J1E7_9HELO|nr:hypothetical protein DID88_005997 [Monilinia fructigena]
MDKIAPLQISLSVPDKLFKDFSNLKTTLGSLTLFLEALATKFGQYSVPNPGAKWPYKVSDFDIDADRVDALWSQITQHQRPDPLGQAINPLGPMLLWSQLLDRAAEFEDKNSRYYVEDHLFENHIIAEDENWETLHQIIPQVCEGSSEKDSWRERIEDFYNTIEGLKAAPPNKADEEEGAGLEFKTRVQADPESESNLFANVFPIHPVPSHDPENLESCGYDFSATILCIMIVVAMRGITPGTPISDALFVDMLQSWQLHQVAGIVPEAIDLWDNNDLVDAAESAAHPIVLMEGTPWDNGEGFRELYWSSEAQNLSNSENWDPEIPRSLHDEMAQMRDARRKRVIQARKERMERDKDYASSEE